MSKLMQRRKVAAEVAPVEASGTDNWVNDRDENGKPKAPESAEVPRLAARKKKEAEPAVEAPAAPAPTPVAKTNPIDFIPTETLLKVIEDMPKEEDFAQNKGKQDALIELTNILKSRPVLAPEPPKGAAPAPAAPAPVAAPVASKSAKGEPFGGKQAPPFGKKDEKDSEKEASAPEGWDGPVNEMKKDVSVDKPHMLAHWMKSEGYTPHKASFVLRRLGAKHFYNKLKKAMTGGGGSWGSSNEETGAVLEERGRTKEIAEAHAKINESPAKLDRPATELPGKFAAEMTTGSALKKAQDAADKLKALYLDAKGLTDVNDSRPVREAVESVYHAYDMFGEAIKALAKQKDGEDKEEEAQEMAKKQKKSSSLNKFGGLAVAAGE